MRVSDARIHETASAIIPYLHDKIERTRMIDYADIRIAITDALRDGRDIANLASERSLGMVLDYLCEFAA